MHKIGRLRFAACGWEFLTAYLWLILILASAPGCAPVATGLNPTPTPGQSSAASSTAPQATSTETSIPPSQTPASLPSPSPKVVPQICAPLPGYSSGELADAISNPYNPPISGSDDPHQGVDFAVEEFSMAQAGGQVQSVLAGTVVLVLNNRFPYGNAVLVETPLEDLPEEWMSRYDLPEIPPTPIKRSALTCPDIEKLPYPPGERRSLYLMYAHLQDIASLEIDQTIACGAPIGTIGQSGNALNPHLHLEARVGPAESRFMGMAHYTTSAGLVEMSQYCLWRVSGIYHLVDPTLLLDHLH